MTLIEVLIAMVILGFISLATYRAISQTYKVRDVLLNEGEFHNTIRLAMSMLGHDIELAYSPWPFLPKPPKSRVGGASESVAPEPTPSAPVDVSFMQQLEERARSKYWLSPISKLGVRPSHFIGTNREISFVTSANARVYRDSRASVFAKVSYSLVDDKSAPSDGPRSLVLVRKSTPRAFEGDLDKDPDERSFPLLRGIEKLEFRYAKSGERNASGSEFLWLGEWDNLKSEFSTTLPQIIEVHLIVNGPVRLRFEGTFLFRTEVPARGFARSF